MNKFSIIITGVVLLFAVLTSCQENEHGTVDLTMPGDVEKPVEAQYTYNHPSAMFNQADFDRVKAMLDDGTAPQAVKDEFQNLKNSTFAAPGYVHTPQTKIVRGDATGTGFPGENYGYAMRDAAAAYQKALLWKLSGDAQYAEGSIKIMNDWAATCTEIASNDANHMLAAGCQGYTFANAAEIMQTYDGWNANDLATVKSWLVRVFASKNKDFLTNHQGTNNCALHYWSNWDLVNMCSYLAIGILTENDDMVNYIVNYFHNGVGNGCIKNMIQGTFADPLNTGVFISQNQESGRDQGHASMSVAVAANLCQMAYTLYQNNQSVSKLDFFAANDNAIMKMGEYTALFNLRNGNDNANATGSWLITATKMPFNEYKYCIGCSCRDQNHGATHTSVADDAGRGSVRPGWEILYNHYAKVKGLSSGFHYSKQISDKIRPEGGSGDNRYGPNSGAFDQLGWGTLMMYRP
ncbi:alginate lyase family protein [Dysgonomonas sp. 511]|uniref:alginate lyase family protein n=1 Tax=Dysgonomonas sp. 511 TaxID=2302930 RepID=UPI0013D4E472|nr:alginate lyase family protein [Dysgonomonas sp. 511]NDV79161.1 cell wall anchor protein [Dysgonomonas sp. 511]